MGNTLLHFPTRKARALLIYLMLSEGAQPRTHLATLLWPETRPERSYASLRNTLAHLQGALREASQQADTSFLLVTHTTLAINPQAELSLDLHTVERAYARARADRASRTPDAGAASLPLLTSAAACHRGDFLTGFSLGDAPDFDEWVADQGELWRRRLGLILDRLSELQFTRGEYADSAETASLWIPLDRLNEVAYRRKMRAHHAAGERGQALESYAACRAVLAAELGVEPETETEALAALIRTQHTPGRPIRFPDRHETPLYFLANLFGGRDIEHQLLVECYRRADAGMAQVVLLQGAAGIGKSRLATEFLGWAASQGARTLRGLAFESSSGLRYQPLIDALRPLFSGEIRAAIEPERGWLAPLAPLFPQLRTHASTPLHDEDDDQSQRFEALARVTMAAAEQAPLLLFLDDMQWADSTTQDFLLYAIRRWQESATRIALVLCLRTESPPAAGLWEWVARLERLCEPCAVELAPLSKRDTVEMVRSILAEPPAGFAEWLFNETRGQPFYLVETLRDLLERRALHPKRRSDGAWAFAVDAEHDLGRAVRVPSTVRAIIRSRLNRLSPAAFTLLAAAAALEQGLTFERLCAITELSDDLGLVALDELLSGGLLVEVEHAVGPSSYLFSHRMIWEVVYHDAGDARRRLYHRRIVAILAAANESTAVIAHHASAAGIAPPD